MALTDEALIALPAAKVLTLYANAKKIAADVSNKRAKEAASIVEQIERLKLQYQHVEGLRDDDPVIIEMHEIIHSSAGKAAIIKAVEAGLPGLAGVEQMLIERFGENYSGRNTGTQAAGEFVGQVMAASGFVKDKQGSMPPGSVAKTAMRYRRKSATKS
ncbi:hypothetical protein ACP4J4_01785 [Aureimonas ureilytica]|uniref:hypothetical protein n=1 Tax=Aureimonas ureilytica TaxID=401562 RepID=UPI003CF2ED53